MSTILARVLVLLTAFAIIWSAPQQQTIVLDAPDSYPLWSMEFVPYWADEILSPVTESYEIGEWMGHADCYYFEYLFGSDAIGCTDGYGEVVTA